MCVETRSRPTALGHPFYEALNELLAKHGFDDFVEEICAPTRYGTSSSDIFPPSCTKN